MGKWYFLLFLLCPLMHLLMMRGHNHSRHDYGGKKGQLDTKKSEPEGFNS